MYYNAFISYPHKTGWRLAKKLQDALQTLAKPWNKSKSLNIFRDESNLTSTPHLWKDILEALENSEHFILLASVNTVSSKWVNDEINFWMKNRSLDKMHIVFIDGNLIFKHGTKEIDWDKTDCLPLALKEVFQEIPLYTDLTQFRDAIDVSLSNEEFKNQIVPLAASIHNKTPEELISEHVRAFKKAKLIRYTLYSFIGIFLVAIFYLYVRLVGTNSVLFEKNNELKSSYIQLQKKNDSLFNAKTTILVKDSLLSIQVDSLGKLVSTLNKRQKELIESNTQKSLQLKFSESILKSYHNDINKWANNRIPNISLPNNYKSELPIGIVFFDYDKISLRPESKQILDDIIELMMNNPNSELTLKSKESWGYTQAYAINISQRRARFIVDYFISKGIKPNRLIAKGMGDNANTIKIKNPDTGIQTIINSINSCCEFYIENI